ncbi:MAG: hypothetical protein HY304_07425 [candidate division Zixibacteria bacterium]|nr:hypothetical protein [candidate division Zixibacteria bacterium]
MPLTFERPMDGQDSHVIHPDPGAAPPDPSIIQPGGAGEPDSYTEFEARYEKQEEIDEGRGPAILAYVPFGCFVALVRFRHNPFAVKHGKQGLMLTFLELLAGLFLIPRLSEYFWVTVVFACLASIITGIYHAVQGREWSIPIVGEWFEKRIEI